MGHFEDENDEHRLLMTKRFPEFSDKFSGNFTSKFLILKQVTKFYKMWEFKKQIEFRSKSSIP